MDISIYTLVSAVLWSSVFIIAMYFMRKRGQIIKQFNAALILTLYMFCILRMLLPFEFSFTKVLSSTRIYTSVESTLRQVEQDTGIHMGRILVIIWISVAAILLIKTAVQYISAMRSLKKIVVNTDPRLDTILESIQSEHKKQIPIKIYRSSAISSPMAVGLKNKYIFLSDIYYTEDELYYILLHEYTHFINGDLSIKMLSKIYCCIFWWNPVVYLLLKDLQLTLELKCDYYVTKDMTVQEKKDYLTVIIKTIKSLKTPKQSVLYHSHAVSFLGKEEKDFIKERFEIVVQTQNFAKSRKNAVALWLICAMLFFMSYAFVIQPSYAAPVGDVESEECVLVPGDDIIILKHPDGSYEISCSYVAQSISKELADQLAGEGIIIKERKE